MTIKESLQKSYKNIISIIPILIGILLLVSLIEPYLGNYYNNIFTGNLFLDPLIGAVAGSISFGIPVTSYVVGGELLERGVSLLAVSAFILAWSTVGLGMLPLEAKYLGKKFAVSRNIINFVFALIISALTVLTLKLF